MLQLSNWELVCLEPGVYCYFQGEMIRKLILLQKEDTQKRQKDTYYEYNVTAMTKEIELFYALKLSGEGGVLLFGWCRISIVNENTQII